MLCVDQGMESLSQAKDEKQYPRHNPEYNLTGGAPGEDGAAKSDGQGKTAYTSDEEKIAEPVDIAEKSLP